MDDLARKHLDHDCLTYKEVCGTGQKQIKFNQVPLDRATEYAAEDADVTLRLWTRFSRRLPHERVARVYEMVDRPLVARRRPNGAGGHQSRPRRAHQAQPRIFRADRRAGGKNLRRGRLHIHHRQPAATRRDPVQPHGPEGRPQGQVGHLVDRRQPSSSGCRGRACRSRSLVLEWRQLTKLQLDLYRCAAAADQPRNRPRPHLLFALRRADRPALLDRPQPPEHPDPHRDRPPHPRRLRRRAGLCHARRPITARSSFASPRIWPTCRSSAPPSPRAPTSTT